MGDPSPASSTHGLCPGSSGRCRKRLRSPGDPRKAPSAADFCLFHPVLLILPAERGQTCPDWHSTEPRAGSRPLTLLPSSTAARLTPPGAYALLLLAIGLSRVFVLAHFPHQVVGGILAGERGWGQRSIPLPRGISGTFPSPRAPLVPPHLACPPRPGAALGWGLQARTPVARSPGFFAAAALALLLGSVALHSAVIAAGIDIDW